MNTMQLLLEADVGVRQILRARIVLVHEDSEGYRPPTRATMVDCAVTSCKPALGRPWASPLGTPYCYGNRNKRTHVA